MDEPSLRHLRAQAMIAFEDGRITETEELYHKLLHSDPPLPPAQQLACRQDRSTVRALANNWHGAMDDLEKCETLIPKLVPFMRKPTVCVILHARVKLFANPHADTYDLDAASDAISKLRGLSTFPWLVDELDSGIALQQEDWERCIRCSSKALNHLEAEGWRRPVALLHRRIGESYLQLNQFDLAQEHLDAAYEFLRKFGTPEDVAESELTLARLESQSGKHDEAWDHATHALGEMELLIRNFRVVAEQQRFLKDKLRLYDACFDIGLAKGGKEGRKRAWTIAERAKSFYLCQLLANANVQLFDGIDPREIEHLRQLEEQLDSCARALVICSDDEREARQQQQAQVSQARQKLLSQIMKENPRWAAARAPVRAGIQAILSAVASPWVPVSYFWREGKAGSSRLFIFYVGGDRELHHTIVPWSKEELAALGECRRLLGDHFGPTSDADKLQPVLTKLFPPELLEELGKSPNAHLLISPHGQLRGLPMHALDLGDEDYLIEHWPVQYIPTLAMIKSPRATPATNKVLLMGCPATPQNLGELTGVPGEIDKLHSLWEAKRPGSVDSCIIPSEGSPAQAGYPVTDWHKYQMLHFSCHGKFPPEQPFDAALCLGKDEVRVTELFAVRLQASLITLSACNLGKQSEIAGTSGDEWIGIYLPMLYAGAGRLLVSLWEANADTAETIMLRLHSARLDALPAADALQMAICDVIKNSLLAFWANWYLVGVPEYA